MQVNRQIKDNPALDDVDHALGRPYRPFSAYHDCQQGRTCPLRVRRRMTIKPLVMEILAAIARRKKDE